MAAKKNPYTMHPGFARMGARMAEAGMDEQTYLAAAMQYVEDQYSGKKAALRPLYDELLKVCLGIAPGVTASPGKTIVPIYRTHVIAQIKPATNTRIDLGLALGDMKTPKRLIDTGGFEKKDRITRRIEITSLDDIDDDVRKWLKTAWERDA